MDGGCQNTWTYEGWLSQEMTKLEMILEESAHGTSVDGWRLSE